MLFFVASTDFFCIKEQFISMQHKGVNLQF